MISFVVNLSKYYTICYRHFPKGALVYFALYLTEVRTDMTHVKHMALMSINDISLVKHINMLMGFSAANFLTWDVDLVHPSNNHNFLSYLIYKTLKAVNNLFMTFDGFYP